jgi:hypothetical protein
MKYEILIGVKVKNKEYAIGEIVTTKDIPQKSIKWLMEQGIIKKITKADIERKLQEATQVHDFDTEFEEVAEEE